MSDGGGRLPLPPTPCWLPSSSVVGTTPLFLVLVGSFMDALLARVRNLVDLLNVCVCCLVGLDAYIRFHGCFDDEANSFEYCRAKITLDMPPTWRASCCVFVTTACIMFVRRMSEMWVSGVLGAQGHNRDTAVYPGSGYQGPTSSSEVFFVFRSTQIRRGYYK